MIAQQGLNGNAIIEGNNLVVITRPSADIWATSAL
jgi:hypothetical protein